VLRTQRREQCAPNLETAAADALTGDQLFIDLYRTQATQHRLIDRAVLGQALAYRHAKALRIGNRSVTDAGPRDASEALATAAEHPQRRGQKTHGAAAFIGQYDVVDQPRAQRIEPGLEFF